MEVHHAIAMISSEAAGSLAPAAAGVLIAVPAVWSYNYLRRRIDLLEVGIPRNQFERKGHFQIAQSLPLAKPFSGLPAYPLMTAPSLALLLVCIALYQWHTSTGLSVSPCPDKRGDRTTLLRITKAGELYLNFEKEDWSGLSARLSQIYSLREHRAIYLLADESVSFQTAADAIDLVRNVPDAGGTYSLDISVWLITPSAMKTSCPVPVVIRSGGHASKGWQQRVDRNSVKSWRSAGQ